MNRAGGGTSVEHTPETVNGASSQSCEKRTISREKSGGHAACSSVRLYVSIDMSRVRVLSRNRSKGWLL